MSFPAERAALASITPERQERKLPPTPTFHGMLTTPETFGHIPNGKPVIAAFNAAVLHFPTDGNLLGIYRVQTDSHEEGKADGTNYLGMQQFHVTADGLQSSSPLLIDAKTLLAPEDMNKNPEDLRLDLDSQTGRVFGALTEAGQLTREQLSVVEHVAYNDSEKDILTTVPYVATLEGAPMYDSATGNVVGVTFEKATLAKEMIDGQERELIGKNAWVERKNGIELLRYRPEFVDGQVNQTHMRTMIKGDDGYWHRITPDGVYSTENLQELLPPGNQLLKFGLNGKTIGSGESAFRIDHIASQAADGTVEYGFITVNGQMKPLISYGEVITLLEQSGVPTSHMLDLSGKKRVIYCNGYSIVGDRLAMAFTVGDRAVAVFSYLLKDITEYATQTKDNGFLARTFPSPSASRRDASLAS